MNNVHEHNIKILRKTITTLQNFRNYIQLMFLKIISKFKQTKEL